MRLAWLWTVAVATPAGAADCVSGMDLETGVLARFDNGTVVRLGIAEDGSYFIEDELDSPHGPYRTVLKQGFWPTEAFDFSPDGTPNREDGMAWLYDDVEALPVIEEGLVWSGWATPMVGGMLGRSNNELVSVKWTGSVILGDCEYDALEVLTLIDQATEAPLIVRNLYLTDLGLAVPWTVVGEGEPRSEMKLVELEVEASDAAPQEP